MSDIFLAVDVWTLSLFATCAHLSVCMPKHSLQRYEMCWPWCRMKCILQYILDISLTIFATIGGHAPRRFRCYWRVHVPPVGTFDLFCIHIIFPLSYRYLSISAMYNCIGHCNNTHVRRVFLQYRIFLRNPSHTKILQNIVGPYIGNCTTFTILENAKNDLTIETDDMDLRDLDRYSKRFKINYTEGGGYHISLHPPASDSFACYWNTISCDVFSHFSIILTCNSFGSPLVENKNISSIRRSQKTFHPETMSLRLNAEEREFNRKHKDYVHVSTPVLEN